MKTMEKFNAVCSRMMNMDSNYSMDFDRLCLENEASVREMDDMLYTAFGMSGDEIVRQFHEGRLYIAL